MNITRGFRSRAGRDRVLPPGQYDVGSDWPVLTAEATPSIDIATWSFSIRGLVEEPMTWTWDEIPGVARRVLRRRHPLCHHLVQTRGHLSGRIGGHAARRCPTPSVSEPRAGDLVHRLLDESPAGRCQRWSGLGGLGNSRGNPFHLSTAVQLAYSSPTSTFGRAQNGSPVEELLDHDEPGFWSATGTTTWATPGWNSDTKVTELAAAVAVPHPGKWQRATVVEVRRETHLRQDLPPRARGAHHLPGGPALHRAAHCPHRPHRIAVGTRSPLRPTSWVRPTRSN